MNTTARQERLAAFLYGGFVRCPTTGKVLGFLKGDDKVLCHCRQSNPEIPQERTEETGTHIIRFCKSATAAEFVAEAGGVATS